MARTKINIPPSIIAEINIPVRISDINYGNHLGNDSLVSVLHEARVSWLAQAGYSELSVEGISLIMSELEVVYKNESFYGDVLTIKIAVGEISAAGFEIYYHIFNQYNKEIAKAKTGMVCYNYDTKRVSAVPSNLMSFLGHGT